MFRKHSRDVRPDVHSVLQVSSSSSSPLSTPPLSTPPSWEGGRMDGAPEGARNARSLISEPTNHQISAECTTLEANHHL